MNIKETCGCEKYTSILFNCELILLNNISSNLLESLYGNVSNQ